jgi:hypothetical protein
MIRLAQLPARKDTISVQMKGYMSGHSPVERTMTGTPHDVRATLREEYRQHLMRMAQCFLDATEHADNEDGRHNRSMLMKVLRGTVHADHIQMASMLLETMQTVHVGHTTPRGTTWYSRPVERDEQGQFLARMLPSGEGYAKAYALMIDLGNTLEAYLTDHSSLWVMGEWQQLPDADGNTITMRPWEQRQAA